MGTDFDEGNRCAPLESWAVPFRKALGLRGRPESKMKWYLIWAKRFAAYLSGRPLHLATRNDAEGFLTTLASSQGITAWLERKYPGAPRSWSAWDRTGTKLRCPGLTRTSV